MGTEPVAAGACGDLGARTGNVFSPPHRCGVRAAACGAEACPVKSGLRPGRWAAMETISRPAAEPPAGTPGPPGSNQRQGRMRSLRSLMRPLQRLPQRAELALRAPAHSRPPRSARGRLAGETPAPLQGQRQGRRRWRANLGAGQVWPQCRYGMARCGDGPYGRCWAGGGLPQASRLGHQGCSGGGSRAVDGVCGRRGRADVRRE